MEVNNDIGGRSHTKKYDSRGVVMLLIVPVLLILAGAVETHTEVKSRRLERRTDGGKGGSD